MMVGDNCDIYLNNPNTKLTIEEFDRDNEKFIEVDPESLWSELNNEATYGKGPFFLLVTADEWNHDDDRLLCSSMLSLMTDSEKWIERS